MISIVIPSYNQEEYIATCLDSIFFQDYRSIEIIIVEDCSTDDSLAVIEDWLHGVETETVSYAAYYNDGTGAVERAVHKRYNRPGRTVTLIRNDRNMGATWSYNRGLRQATGKYCTFVAGDDVCHPQMFSILARPLDEDRADFVYGDMFIVNDAGRVLREFRLPDYDFERSFCDWYLCGVATLYRRELHEKYGYYDENAFADDHECYLRFSKNDVRFVHIPKTIYSVRSHENRQTGLHAQDYFQALKNQSKELVLDARSFHARNGGLGSG